MVTTDRERHVVLNGLCPLIQEASHHRFRHVAEGCDRRRRTKQWDSPEVETLLETPSCELLCPVIQEGSHHRFRHAAEGCDRRG